MLFFKDNWLELHHSHVLEVLRSLPDESVHMIATSPPYYGLRDYGTEPVGWPSVEFVPVSGLPPVTIPAQQASLGLEKEPWDYVGHLVAIFREARRVLRDDGTLWLNLGDSYVSNSKGTGGATPKQVSNAGSFFTPVKDLKVKDLMMIPARVALALQADGWWLRRDVIWNKKNPMPESVTDRPTTAHEYIFLLAKSERYFWDKEAVAENATKSGVARQRRGVSANHKNINGAPGQPQHSMNQPRQNDKTRNVNTTRNLRSVLTIATTPYKEAHFATWPPALAEIMIKAGTSAHGVCDACGTPYRRIVEKTGTSLPVSERHGRTGHNGQPPQISGNYWTGPTTAPTDRWEPGCDCAAGVVPATVLDIFNGAGTTGLVTNRLGRRYVGIDLNAEYCQMAVDRIRSDKNAAIKTNRPVVTDTGAAQLNLFGGK